MSAVKRWLYRHTHSSTATTGPPPTSPTIKTHRGRSQSLDVQSLQNSGLRTVLANANVSNRMLLSVFRMVGDSAKSSPVNRTVCARISKITFVNYFNYY